MWRDAALVAGKDLRVELRSRVATNQVAPYALVVLLLFGFAFDQDKTLLREAAPGLFWVAVLLCSLLAVQRSFAMESADGARDGLRMSALDPAGIFLGKAVSIAAVLAGLEVLLGVGIVVLFSSTVSEVGLLLVAAVVATVGLAAAGVLYGVMAAGARARETLLPLLLLPIVAPVLLGATEAWRVALGISADDGWRWVGLIGGFAAIYLAAGILAFGTLLEDG
jgi:heme exporter protein B